MDSLATPQPMPEMPAIDAGIKTRPDDSNAAAVDSTKSKVENEDESPTARIERLGRERPEKFKTLWAEVGFCFSIVMSQVLTEYFVSGFTILIPTLEKRLDIPAASSTWPASAFSLVVSSFLLPFGRLADMYGGHIVYLAGTAWLTIISLVVGFSKNKMMLIVLRALQGLGPSAFLPTSLMLLGSVYRPGPRKNIVFGIYGAMAPLGFFIGIFFAGLAGQYTNWGWYFWIGAILSLITTITAYFSIPKDLNDRQDPALKMDWWGSGLIVSGLILLVFAITDSAHAPQGWATPYIYVAVIIGVILLASAVYIEGWVAEMPILPADLFKITYMTPLVISLFFIYGGIGIYLLYATYYMQMIMGGTPMQLVAWYLPTALGGCIIATVGGFVLHLVSGTIMMIIAGAAWIIAPMLFAVMPEGASYWAYAFPAMICTTIGIDITFNITNVFITTSLSMKRQGLAGGLINSVLQLAIAFFLGIADIVATNTSSAGLAQSYKNAFWLEFSGAACGLAILLAFVKIDKAKSDMTVDEKQAEAAWNDRISEDL